MSGDLLLPVAFVSHPHLHPHEKSPATGTNLETSARQTRPTSPQQQRQPCSFREHCSPSRKELSCPPKPPSVALQRPPSQAAPTCRAAACSLTQPDHPESLVRVPCYTQHLPSPLWGRQRGCPFQLADSSAKEPWREVKGSHRQGQ